MEFKSKMIIGAVLMLILFITLTKNAYAYLDPGTGSYFFQLLIAGLLGALFLIKSFWKNLAVAAKSFFLKVSNFIKNFKKCLNK